MVYPKDRIKNYKETRDRRSGVLFAFGIGAFFNLVPFMNFSDLSTVTDVQWGFLIIDTTVLIVSILSYIYYSFKIRGIRKAIGSKELKSS